MTMALKRRLAIGGNVLSITWGLFVFSAVFLIDASGVGLVYSVRTLIFMSPIFILYQLAALILTFLSKFNWMICFLVVVINLFGLVMFGLAGLFALAGSALCLP
jgi:ABC-type long-subunit fatty acid transport system fused permease/ATPase subunit